MSGTMYDMLTTKSADYTTTTLNINPTEIVPERGRKPVEINEGDDGSIEAVVLSDTVSFSVDLYWADISVNNSHTIMDFVQSPSKGNFGARTFQWLHPLDTHTYVVRAIGELTRAWRTGGAEVQKLTLRVEGRVT